MYPAQIVLPMKAELTDAGFEDITTPEGVVDVIENSKGTVLIVVNSVCGCAAGMARPGVKASLNANKTPDRLTTVFAGFDTEAVQKVREYLLPYPPSSPSIALFKDGELVHMIERHNIEGHSAMAIAQNLAMAYDEHC